MKRDEELRVQQLLQLGRVMDAIGEIGDIARIEIAQPPPGMGPGVPGTWTRITGAVLRAEAQVIVYEKLGGPPIADITALLRECNQSPTKQELIVPKATQMLEMLKNFTGNVDWHLSVED